MPATLRYLGSLCVLALLFSSCDGIEPPEPGEMADWIRIDNENLTEPFLSPSELNIDANGDLWLQSTFPSGADLLNGLWQYNGQDWNLYQTFLDSFPDERGFRSQKIISDASGKKWLALSEELISFRAQELERFPLPDELMGDNLFPVAHALDNDGNVIISSGDYLGIFDGQAWELVDLPPGTQVFDLVVKPSNNEIWFGAQNGLFRYAAPQLQFFGEVDQLDVANGTSEIRAVGLVTTLAWGQNEELWIGCTAGLIQFTGTRWNNYGQGSFATNVISISHLQVDSQGTVWLVVLGDFMRLKNDVFTTYQSPTANQCNTGNCTNQIFGLAIDQLDRKYVLWEVTPGNIQIYRTDQD
ncbi:MAG: hypothetical protein AAFR61_06315 [Bacteroidota bacterium]